MKLEITIEYTNGSPETYVIHPPEWAKWEHKTGFIMNQASEKLGISDLMFLAYHSMKRNGGAKPVKPFETWCESVMDVAVTVSDPKVINAEA